MKSLRMLAMIGAGCCIAASAIGADNSALVGKWKGQSLSGAKTIHTHTLDITSVDDGIIKGTAQRHTSANRPDVCTVAEFPVEGPLKGDTFKVTGKATVRGQDCSYTLTATVQDGKLQAQVGQAEFTMTK